MSKAISVTADICEPIGSVSYNRRLFFFVSDSKIKVENSEGT